LNPGFKIKGGGEQMKKTISLLVITVFFTVGSLVILPKESEAIPAFARKLGQSCQMCHWAVPKLNPVGMLYKYNGYRMVPGEGENVWEWKTVPISLAAEVEGVIDRGDLTHKTDLKVEEVEVMFGSAIGERVAVFGEYAFIPDDDEFVAAGRIQLDITGKGNLNIAAGDVDIDFPFLSGPRSIIHQSYLAEEIGFLPGGTVIEFNGQTQSQGPISSYFYNVGVVRDSDVNDQNKLATYYGTLTLGIQGHFLGLHYRFGEEDQAGIDEDVNRFGIVPELYVGPLVITPGYFYADFDNYGGGADLEADDFMLEVLYKATNKLVLGARGDYLDVEQSSLDGDVTAFSVNATYYFLSNVFLAAEYRNIDHDNPNGVPIAGTDGLTEEKVRIFLVAVF
jgi:hypothetical protein